MMGYRYGYGYNMMALGGFFWIICLLVLIAAAFAIYKVTTMGKKNMHHAINNEAVEILKQRYAKGEIDEEQYRKMRETIEK